MRLNLNDNIRVKLTEHGKYIYYHQYDRTNKLLGRDVCKPSYPKVDEDGYTTFQLWCFMELYGVHIGMTLPNVIEPLDIVFDAPIIEERKPGKWNFIGNQMFECTKCGVCYTENQFHQMMVRITDPEFPKFCPNCGADMWGEGEQDG